MRKCERAWRMKRECAMIVLLRDTTVFCAIVKRNEKILLYLHNVRLAPSHHEEGTSSKKCWLLFVMTLLTHSQDSTLHLPSTTIKIFHSFELNLLVASNPPIVPKLTNKPYNSDSKRYHLYHPCQHRLTLLATETSPSQ